MLDINIAGFVNDSITDGPGIRFTIFTQGCPRKCKGCHNPQTQSLTGGTPYKVEQILEKIKNNTLLQGVTFSGGEPLIQAKALIPLATEIKKLGLNIAVYTGYVFEELKSVDGALELLRLCDVLVDGPFVEEKRDYKLKFKGSNNQRIIDLKQTFSTGKIVLVEDERWN